MKVTVTELVPNDSHKSFYGKALVFSVGKTGTQYLQSYRTIVASRTMDGTITRYWDNWSATTGRHIRAFAGINKAQWDALPVVDSSNVDIIIK